jgi:CII-binding regulator of phage lambda lysogenization HflD
MNTNHNAASTNSTNAADPLPLLQAMNQSFQALNQQILTTPTSPANNSTTNSTNFQPPALPASSILASPLNPTVELFFQQAKQLESILRSIKSTANVANNPVELTNEIAALEKELKIKQQLISSTKQTLQHCSTQLQQMLDTNNQLQSSLYS